MDILQQAMPLTGQPTHAFDLCALVIGAPIDNGKNHIPPDGQVSKAGQCGVDRIL